jgi:hypothetical protein
MLERMWKARILIHCSWECKWDARFETVVQFLMKLNICLSYDSAISLLDIYPGEQNHIATQRQMLHGGWGQ